MLIQPQPKVVMLPTLSQCSPQHQWEEVEEYRLPGGWVLQRVCGASPLNVWLALLQPSQC